MNRGYRIASADGPIAARRDDATTSRVPKADPLGRTARMASRAAGAGKPCPARPALCARVAARPGSVPNASRRARLARAPALVALLIGLGACGGGADNTLLCLEPGCTAVATWQGAAKAAVSLVFDDGYQSTLDHTLQPLVDAGLAATHAVPSAHVGADLDGLAVAPLEDWRRAVALGMEVGSHGSTHAVLSQLPAARLTQELEDWLQWWRGIGAQRPGPTLTYPTGRFDDKVIQEARRLGFIAGRATGSGINPPSPPDLLALVSQGTSALDAAGLETTTAQASAAGGWLIERWHLVAESNPTNYCCWNRPADFVAHVKQLRRDQDAGALWVAPLNEVARYVRERDQLRIHTVRTTPQEIVFALATELDPAVFDLPLTLTTVVPASWAEVSVRWSESTAALTVQDLGSDGTRRLVRYRVAPRGRVTLQPR